MRATREGAASKAPRCRAGNTASGLTEGLGGADREARGLPGLEAALQVGGLVQADPPQRGGGQRGRVALRAHHDDLHVGPRQRRDPGLAARIEPPFEHVAADEDRSRHLALDDALLERPDVDQRGAVGQRGERRLRPQPPQAAARLGEQVIDAGRAGRERVAAQPRGGRAGPGERGVRTAPAAAALGSVDGDGLPAIRP